jgi:hypothetical protein
MILVLALLLTAAVIVFTLFVRPQDLPAPEPVSPVAHLEERKARIYENLRDLQFEYRLGKLSDEDYQRTKLGLQAELASTLAEIDRVLGKAPAAAPPVAAVSPVDARLLCRLCRRLPVQRRREQAYRRTIHWNVRIAAPGSRSR